jgi:hypothetical protein
MTTTTHILGTSASVTCTMFFNEETAEMRCEWSKPPPWSKKKARQILAEYEPWRNEIVTNWSLRTGKSMLLVNGNHSVTFIDGASITTEQP